MGVDELKRALVEVNEFCASQGFCRWCPFEKELPDRRICRLSPSQDNDMIPEYWAVDDWKEDAQDDA